MASYKDILGVLGEFRTELQQSVQNDIASIQLEGISSFATRGAFSAFSTPLTNVHATGVGIRVRQGEIVPDDFVIKVYVYDKLDLGDATPALTRSFQDVEVDVEHLPVQMALIGGVLGNRQEQRPVVGGLSIAPLNEPFVGTLGCFVKRVVSGVEQIYVLSNNHVLADTNQLTVGTLITQPGPERGAVITPNKVFASLNEFIPIRFPRRRFERVVNRFDAALALVIDRPAIELGKMFNINNYTPQIATPVPQMRVIKSGRTTGVTRGTITATNVNGVQVNYGNVQNQIIATFIDTIEIVGDGNRPFSSPGDSGSVILEESTGRPVALLFAGDGRTTTACNLPRLCSRLQILPA